jgi:hypothetical protein
MTRYMLVTLVFVVLSGVELLAGPWPPAAQPSHVHLRQSATELFDVDAGDLAPEGEPVAVAQPGQGHRSVAIRARAAVLQRPDDDGQGEGAVVGHVVV